MNRRGFIGLVTAAAVAPQELIAAAEPAPVLDAAAIGSAYTKALAKSLLQTKETVAVRVLTNKLLTAQEFSALLLPGLNEVFSQEYAKHETEWEGIYENEEALAGEERGCDSTIRPWWEEAGSTSEGAALECRGAGGVYSSLGVGKSVGSYLRKLG